MPKPLAPTFATVYSSVYEDLTTRLGDAQAAQMGPPVASDITPAGDDARVRAWNARNPEATDEAMLQLAARKLAEHTQAGLPIDQAIRATAEDLTHFRYGQRQALYRYGQTGLGEQVREAGRIARLARRETTPDPAPPPPTMRSGHLTNAQMTPAPRLPPPDAPATPPPTMPASMPPVTIPGMPPGMPQGAPPPAPGPLPLGG